MNIITEYATAINKVDFLFNSEYATQSVWGKSEKETMIMAYDNLVDFFSDLYQDSADSKDMRMYHCCVQYCYIQMAKIELGHKIDNTPK